MQTAIRLGKFRSYQIAVIVVNGFVKSLIKGGLLKRGLSLAANRTLTRSMKIFAGPIGTLLSTGWLIADIAGPAYRVTTYAVIMIAYLRRHQEEQETEGNSE